MEIYVAKNHVDIIQNESINKNEYNVNTCNFTFEEAYSNLVKKALFTNAKGKTYEMLITNNICQIPSEVLDEIGLVVVGVYGYETQNEELVLRYSPKPSTFFVQDGSYKDDAENTSVPTPTELEQIEQAIENINSDLENFCTEQDVQNLIDEAYTNVMEGEY